MSCYKLSFGNIKILQHNLAEVIVDQGIVMDEIMIDEYHNFLLTTLKPPFGLLINKKHSYSYTFAAQKSIAHLEEIKSMAVVTKTTGAVMSTETLINVNGEFYRNTRLFQERGPALDWLQKQLL